MRARPKRFAVFTLLAIFVGFDVGVAAADFSAAATDRSCIAVVLPTVQGIPGNGPEIASGIRDLVSNYLTGPTVKVVPLEAKLPSQAVEEAKQKACETMLYLTLTKKAGGGRLTKALGQAAGTSAWYLPGGGTAASATARAAASVGLQTASSLAASTKAKDEVRLEYRLQSAGGPVQFGPKTESQTATVDGEDLLTPVAMRAAEAIVTRKEHK
jgi:hypothetical protein